MSFVPSVIIASVIFILLFMLISSLMISRSRSFPAPFVPMPLEVISVLSIFCENFIKIILIDWSQFHLFNFLIACSFDLFHHIFNFDFVVVQNHDLTLEPTIFVVLDHSNFFYWPVFLEEFLDIVVRVISVDILHVDAFVLLVPNFAFYLISVHCRTNWVDILQFFYILLYLLFFSFQRLFYLLHVYIAHVASRRHTKMNDVSIL